MRKINLYISSSEIKALQIFLMKLALFSPVLAVLVCVNFFYTPADIFVDTVQTREMAGILHAGKNLVTSSYYDARLIKKFYIEGLGAPPDIAVIGSSRVGAIGHNIFPDKKIVNSWTPQGTLADDLAILYQYEKKGFYPGTLIIGFDPWVMTANYNVGLSLSLKDDALKMLSVLGYSDPVAELFPGANWGNIFSLSNFQGCLTASFYMMSHQRFKYAVFNKAEDNDNNMMLSDGRLSWFTKHQALSTEQVNEDVARFLKERLSETETATWGLDEKLQDVLERFIRRLQEKKVKVVLFLAPYHPFSYRELVSRKRYQVIARVESYIRAVSLRYHVPLIGSYNPTIIGFKDTDFLDWVHARDRAVKGLLIRNASLFERSDR